MMKPAPPPFLLLAPLVLAVLGLLPAAGAAADEKEPASSAPKTETVEPQRFVVEIAATGVFVPRGAVEVAYRPEVYGGALEVVEAVSAKRVQKGETLVRFDDEEAKRLLERTRRGLEAARLKLEQQAADLEVKATGAQIKKAQLESRKRHAEEDLTRFLETDRPLRIAQSLFSQEGVENRLKDQAEELDQLEKMYKADDLTEETEEIVLRRARRNLARSRRNREFVRQRHKTLLEVTLPREEESLRLTLRQRQAELAAHGATAGRSLDLGKLGLAGAKEAFDHQGERLRDLERDVDALRVRAPKAGLAVPGSFRGGKWGDLDALRLALVPGGRVKARQVLYTIVEPGNVAALVKVGEGDLRRIEVGREAQVTGGVLVHETLPAEVAG
ncbi:MAG: hypothetical protein ACC662_00535, partial [Planctomycetota bacterium]